MPGHYTARKSVLDMLRLRLPECIEAMRVEAAGDLDFVPDPDPEHGYRLLDTIPDDDINPRILVSSTDGQVVRSDGHGPNAVVTCEYTVTVGVTTFASRTGGMDAEQASIARDVLTDAVKWCLRLHRSLGPATSVKVADSGATSTGPSTIEDKLKRPTSIGQVDVIVTQDEQLVLHPAPAAEPTVTVEPITE